MKYKIIKNEEQYNHYLKLLEEYLGSDNYSDDVELLTILIDTWEHGNYSFDEIEDPIKYLNFAIDEGWIDKKKLINVLGDKTIASRILNKKRLLNLKQIRNIHKSFNIPVDILIKEYELNN